MLSFSGSSVQNLMVEVDEMERRTRWTRNEQLGYNSQAMKKGQTSKAFGSTDTTGVE